MNRISRSFWLPFVGMTLALLGPLGGEAKADLFEGIGLYDGGSAPIVSIQYTGTGGQVVTASVYADPQIAVGDGKNNMGTYVPIYCIDLVHDNYLGSSYTITPWSSPNITSKNEIAWLAENAAQNADSSVNPVDYRAATQLAIWKLLDPVNFGFWGGDSTLSTLYTSLLNSSAYNPNFNYVPGANFFAAHHDGVLYQDLVGAWGPPSLGPLFSLPEPSTFAISGIGALGMLVFGLRRRSMRTR
jgi:hypothetical protein